MKMLGKKLIAKIWNTPWKKTDMEFIDLQVHCVQTATKL